MNIAAVANYFLKIVNIITVSYFLREKNNFLIRKMLKSLENILVILAEEKLLCFVLLFFYSVNEVRRRARALCS